MKSAVTIAVVHSPAEGDGCSGGAAVPPRPVHHATSAQHAVRHAAGISAPVKRSCVLMMRTASCVRFAASVWARIIASPSRISTSDGGITTPSVLATQTSAAPRAGASPLASRRGCTVRASIETLAPTDPFIGAASTPRLKPASEAPAPVRASAWLPTRISVRASGRWLSNAPISTYSGSACSRSCSSRPSTRAGIAVSNGHVKVPVARPSNANNIATPMSRIHAGSPVATSSPATAASMATPTASIRSAHPLGAQRVEQRLREHQ